MVKKNNKRQPCIYRMYNPVEDKSYIGQAVDGLTRRKNKHIRKAFRDKRDSKLAIAIRTYFVHLEWEVIEYIDPYQSLEEIQDQLNRKEIEYISIYNSIENGYNTQPGGGGCVSPKRRTLEEKKLKRKIWKQKYYLEHPDKLEEKRIRQYASIDRRRDEINRQRNARRALDRAAVNAKMREHRKIREEKDPSKKIERLEKHKIYMQIRNKQKKEERLNNESKKENQSA